MKVKKDVTLPTFLQRVNECDGEVLYVTPEGDSLNLKSQLSQYVFLVAVNAESKGTLPAGTIVCSEARDMEALQPFLTD